MQFSKKKTRKIKHGHKACIWNKPELGLKSVWPKALLSGSVVEGALAEWVHSGPVTQQVYWALAVQVTSLSVPGWDSK